MVYQHFSFASYFSTEFILIVASFGWSGLATILCIKLWIDPFLLPYPQIKSLSDYVSFHEYYIYRTRFIEAYTINHIVERISTYTPCPLFPTRTRKEMFFLLLDSPVSKSLTSILSLSFTKSKDHMQNASKQIYLFFSYPCFLYQ